MDNPQCGSAKVRANRVAVTRVLHVLHVFLQHAACLLLTFNVCIRRNAAQIFEANNRLTASETDRGRQRETEGGSEINNA